MAKKILEFTADNTAEITTIFIIEAAAGIFILVNTSTKGLPFEPTVFHGKSVTKINMAPT
ncbi:hypothetical protein GCM10020331_094580 [Ectobacillus funiculus]